MQPDAPQPGTLIVYDDGYMSPRFRIARFVKAGPKMWTIENWWQHMGWDGPGRRHISRWHPLPEGSDPATVAARLEQENTTLNADIAAAKAAYLTRIKRLASLPLAEAQQ